MGRLFEEIPDAKFLITGRSEPRIQSGFHLELLRPLTDVFVPHEVEPSTVDADIRLFLEHGLSELYGEIRWCGSPVKTSSTHLQALTRRRVCVCVLFNYTPFSSVARGVPYVLHHRVLLH